MTARPFNCHDQEQPSWLDRARRAVALVQAAVRPGAAPLVCDIGCGDMKLRRLLVEALPAVDYRGFDLVPQHADVQPLDIRAQSLPAPCDVAVMLGVMEYVPEPGAVLARLGRQARHLVISYVASDYSRYTAEQLQKLGWAHHLTHRGFADLLRGSGFAIEQEVLTANGRTVLWLCRSGGGAA